MEKPRVICWDLDETLGFFRNLVSARGGGKAPHPQDSYVLRKDLIRALNRMIDKGYRHVVVSSAKLEYSKNVLSSICLDAYFDKVVARSQLNEAFWGKRYLPAAEAFNLDEADALSNVLVIANQASDEPVDLGVVFLHDRRGLEVSAFEYEQVAEALWERGEGSFKRGFDFFFETGRKVSCLDQEMNFMLVSSKVTETISADLGYKNSPCNPDLKIPIMYNFRSA
ncbi:MAG: HAD family hydrolase [Candidatus Abyssobacteria bacterium SURF_5]|uniref:HAD family hydrolase n=1 Tax=Abyssobacteria bacterium (strain SURF_5) TaxID=2093360 RepID=A0A3A4NRT0_ABYX5|nr:MAG: HAD family hydrolase [Candidatus Abyssubacteria bacterium SURF_5]